MIRPQNCALSECASAFPFKDECALVKSGCCVQDMLSALSRSPDGARFPMDLRPGGNPFVNAMRAAGLVLVQDDITRLSAALRQSGADEREASNG